MKYSRIECINAHKYVCVCVCDVNFHKFTRHEWSELRAVVNKVKEPTETDKLLVKRHDNLMYQLVLSY